MWTRVYILSKKTICTLHARARWHLVQMLFPSRLKPGKLLSLLLGGKVCTQAIALRILFIWCLQVRLWTESLWFVLKNKRKNKTCFCLCSCHSGDDLYWRLCLWLDLFPSCVDSKQLVPEWGGVMLKVSVDNGLWGGVYPQPIPLKQITLLPIFRSLQCFSR